MSWLESLRGARESEAEGPPPEEPSPPGVERGCPGIEALFSGVAEGGSGSILDLGSSVSANFRLYHRFARQIRFADFLADPPRGNDLREALRALDPPAGGIFHLVLLWNLLDLLTPAERESVMARLHQITGRGSRIYVVVDSSGSDLTQSMRFTLLDLGRLRQEAVGPPLPLRSPLLPAEVEKLLRPFDVSRAFTLKLGLREYLGVKESDALRHSAWDLR